MFGVLHRLDLGFTSHPNEAAFPYQVIRVTLTKRYRTQTVPVAAPDANHYTMDADDGKEDRDHHHGKRALLVGA